MLTIIYDHIVLLVIRSAHASGEKSVVYFITSLLYPSGHDRGTWNRESSEWRSGPSRGKPFEVYLARLHSVPVRFVHSNMNNLSVSAPILIGNV